MQFPLDNLDLAPYLDEEPTPQERAHSLDPALLRSQHSSSSLVGVPGCTRYVLFAVCNHFGTIYGGHYTAFCRSALTSNWYKYDDTRVTLMKNPGDVITPSAYLLFYQRVDTCDLASARHWVGKIAGAEVRRFLSHVRESQESVSPKAEGQSSTGEKPNLSETCL